MQLNDEAKKAVNNLGDSINRAVSESTRIAEAIERLRALGYEPHLTLRLEIALDQLEPENAGNETEDAAENIELELTDEDLRTLRRMKIKF